MSSSDLRPQHTTRQWHEDTTNHPPAAAATARRARVRFYPHVMIYLTISMADISPRERSDCWYSKCELAAEQDENVRRITQYRNTEDHKEEHKEEEWTLRGLEHLTGMGAFQAKTRARDDVVSAVLGCQGEARRSGDASRSRRWRSIADASIMTTEHSRRLATRAGFRDAAVALRLRHNNSVGDSPAGLRKRRDVDRADAPPRRRQHALHRTPPNSISQDLLDQVDAVLDETPETSTAGSAPSVMENLPFLFPLLPGRSTLAGPSGGAAAPEHSKNGILRDLLAARVRAILAGSTATGLEEKRRVTQEEDSGIEGSKKKNSSRPLLSTRGLQLAAGKLISEGDDVRTNFRDAFNSNRQ